MAKRKKEKKEVVNYLSKNKTKVFSLIKVYNNLCPSCKLKLMLHIKRKVDMPYNKYCKDCQKMANEILK